MRESPQRESLVTLGKVLNAQVAELVDALVLEASVERRVGSSPTLGTNYFLPVAQLVEQSSAHGKGPNRNGIFGDG